MHLGLLTKSCDYGGFEEETIRNHVVMSCDSSRLQQCLLWKKDLSLSLELLQTIAQTMVLSMESFLPHDNSINAIRRLEITLNDRNREMKWLRCRKSGYLENNKIFKARSITCNLCQKVGHFVSEC